ncbi:MAG: F0F1 ATP synthase subunit B [Proteobacteria bacterium]|nr:F0F1 ATP synthase subunit B [Pseudomonadota bacterium]MBI3498303.1 F0F1 ATP synthase subunit B [Pseudomonadota bacterium]
MFSEPEFWVAVAFVLFVALVGRPGARFITTALDDRATAIRQEIEAASRLRAEAEATLADYKKKHAEALQEAAAILAHAKSEARRLQAEAGEQAELRLKRREAQAHEKIAQAEAQALKEVRDLAVDLAVAATRRVLAEKIVGASADQLVDKAIAELPSKLHS